VIYVLTALEPTPLPSGGDNKITSGPNRRRCIIVNCVARMEISIYVLCFVSWRLIGERYINFGFGGAQTDSNQRLMYTSA
jgi:hypothetical protein